MSCYYCKKSVTPHNRHHGLHKACFSKWFGISADSHFQDINQRQVSSNEPMQSNYTWQGVNSSFFHGKFKKYSAKLGNKSYLLKVQEADYPDLPGTEFLCNQIAIVLGIEIPPFYLIDFENEIPTFVCENFMHTHQGANLVHIYHYLDDPKEYNCEALYEAILHKTQRITEAYRFVEITLFDALIGNHDRHGRNLGLIQTSKGFQLSPFYDNPSYLGIEIEQLLGAQHEPRGKIATQQTKDPTIRDYINEWKRLELYEQVEKFYKKIDINEILNKIDDSYVSEKRKNALKRLVLNRFKEYEDAINA